LKQQLEFDRNKGKQREPLPTNRFAQLRLLGGFPPPATAQSGRHIVGAICGIPRQSLEYL